MTLDELFKLYETANKRQSRLMRTIAAAMGAEMEEPEEEVQSSPEIHRDQFVDGLNIPVPGVIKGAQDAARMPFGLGYEVN